MQGVLRNCHQIVASALKGGALTELTAQVRYMRHPPLWARHSAQKDAAVRSLPAASRTCQAFVYAHPYAVDDVSSSARVVSRTAIRQRLGQAGYEVARWSSQFLPMLASAAASKTATMKPREVRMPISGSGIDPRWST
jgi:hypothetical protein